MTEFLLIVWLAAAGGYHADIRQFGPFDSEQLCAAAARTMIDRMDQHGVRATQIETLICVQSSEG